MPASIAEIRLRGLGLVTLEQMILVLLEAVESPALGVRIMEVPEIRAATSTRLAN